MEKKGILSGKLNGTKQSPTPPKDTKQKDVKLLNGVNKVDYRKDGK